MEMVKKKMPKDEDLTPEELEIIEKNMKEGRIAISKYIYEMNGKPHPLPPEKK
jgi:hypothetical protein